MANWFSMADTSVGIDQLRYTAGDDAKATLVYRNQVGAEAFRIVMDQRFFG